MVDIYIYIYVTVLEASLWECMLVISLVFGTNILTNLIPRSYDSARPPFYGPKYVYLFTMVSGGVWY